MTELITLSYKNYSQMLVETDPGVLAEMQEHFSFYVPGYRYMPAYKSKMWDGKLRLLDARTRCMPAGLVDAVKEFASNRGRNYSVELKDSKFFGTIGSKDDVSMDEFYEFVQDLNIHAGGQRIEPRDYQLAAAYLAIKNYRQLIISPTGTGKSLVMYMIMRWVLHHIQPDQKFIIIVPTTTLTKQLIGDFEEYAAADEEFIVDHHCYPIFAGQDKNAEHQVLVSTWQSLAKFPKMFYKNVGAVIGDEAHTCSAKICTKILDNCYNAKYRIGTTGTLDGSNVHEMSLTGIFGPMYTATTTKEQIDSGNLAELKINIMRLKYPDEERRYAKFKYDEEIKFITKHDRRNKFVANLTLSTEGNTLVMFRYKEHGQLLYDLISAKAHKDRKIFLIHGEVDTEFRNNIRPIVEKETDAIIVASIGTFSTGINIKNLHNLVFAAPHKGRIKVLQSLGRALRKSTDGRDTIMYDICDDVSWKQRKNFALIHSMERTKQYAAEKLTYQVYEIKL